MLEQWIQTHPETIAKGGIGLIIPWAGAYFFSRPQAFSHGSHSKRVLGNFLTFVLFTVTAFWVSIFWVRLAQEAGIREDGLLFVLKDHGFDIPGWVQLLFAFLAIDLASYWIHRLEHRFAWLWRLHSVHHSDREIDLSTHVRKHPLTALYASTWFVPVVIALGLPAYTLLIYNMVADTNGFLGHSNFEKFPMVNRICQKLFLISPVEHHVHHSMKKAETNSNYGLTITLWDRIFGTYQTRDTTKGIRYGLREIPKAWSEFPANLRAPFSSRGLRWTARKRSL